MTLPVEPLRSNRLVPAMKLSSLMLCVVATTPPTSTDDVGEKNTPLGLLKNTWPLAVMRPKIWLGLLSFTRLSVMAFALGCTKFTEAELPRLKVSQFTTARWLLWFTVSAAACAVAVWLRVAVPRTTLPPLGNC